MMMDEIETKFCLRSFSIECKLKQGNPVTCDNYASYHKNLTPISNFALSNQLNFYLLISQNQYRFFILQITNFLFRKLQMFISQNTDFHFISFGKL